MRKSIITGIFRRLRFSCCRRFRLVYGTDIRVAGSSREKKRQTNKKKCQVTEKLRTDLEKMMIFQVCPFSNVRANDNMR
jgi:hypothetical protein